MAQVLVCNSKQDEIDLIQAAIGNKFTLHSMTSWNEEPLELKVTTRGTSLDDLEYLTTIKEVSRRALDNAKLVFSNRLDGRVRSIIAIPLILHDPIGAIAGQNLDPGTAVLNLIEAVWFHRYPGR